MKENYGEILKQYPSGAMRKFRLDNGYEFEAYIPSKWDRDTNIILYEHGNDDGYYANWHTFSRKFQSEGCDSIVIRADRRDSISLYNYIVKQFDLSEASRMPVCHSGGTSYSLQETAQMIKQNPNAAPPVSVILDGYVPTAYLSSIGVVDTLKEGNAIVLAVGGPNASYFDEYYNLAKTGVNVVILNDKSNFGKSHAGVNDSFMEGGLLEYALGTAMLPNRYEILVYDQDKQSFVELGYNTISSINGVYNYFGVKNPSSNKFSFGGLSKLIDFSLVSNSLNVKNYLNPIARIISATNILKGNVDLDSLSSTTNVPAGISNVVRDYFVSVNSLLDNMTSAFADIEKIHPNYLKVDQELLKSIEHKN